MRKLVQFPAAALLATLLLLCGLGLYRSFFSFGPQDIKEYWQLMHSLDSTGENAAPDPYMAKQQHQNMHKDIWFNDKGQRLQMCLRSTDTELILEHHGNATEVVENMSNLQCYMQEELYYVLPDGREVVSQPDGHYALRHEPTTVVAADLADLQPRQIIRFMEADAATYSYKGDRFTADHVHVSHFSAPGHQLIETVQGLKPLMSGLAQKVEFSLIGNELNFKAYQLKATLHTYTSNLR